jgi:hypothetical protein
MLDKYASAFAVLADSMRSAERRLWSIGAFSSRDLLEPHEPSLSELVTLLRVAQVVVGKIPALRAIRPEIERVMKAATKTAALASIHMDVKRLLERILDELDSHQFLYVRSDLVPLYERDEPFGDAVGLRFPEATADISEAGKCLALGRFTASVFHLMRVMELAVQKFGVHLSITLDPRRESWYQIVVHVNRAINAMPAKDVEQVERRARYAMVAAHMNAVRLAWRNEVMHPKATFTEEEATGVWTHVEALMRDLAILAGEQGEERHG